MQEVSCCREDFFFFLSCEEYIYEIITFELIVGDVGRFLQEGDYVVDQMHVGISKDVQTLRQNILSPNSNLPIKLETDFFFHQGGKGACYFHPIITFFTSL